MYLVIFSHFSVHSDDGGVAGIKKIECTCIFAVLVGTLLRNSFPRKYFCDRLANSFTVFFWGLFEKIESIEADDRAIIHRQYFGLYCSWEHQVQQKPENDRRKCAFLCSIFFGGFRKLRLLSRLLIYGWYIVVSSWSLSCTTLLMNCFLKSFSGSSWKVSNSTRQ